MFGTALIAAEDLVPITSAITDNAAVLIPAGLTILALMVGISLIPRIIYKFL
jgi:hypothetical protein